ncbi:MAG: GNAT family N-acetyltransferase [Myxococcales bacterium]|nr:GNAT family N-acetyltransferase [Myxococcales bacterium]
MLAHEACVGSHPCHQNTQVTDDGTSWYQVLTPSAPDPWLNEVLYSHLPNDEEAEAVSRTIDEFRAAKCPLKWSVGKWSSAGIHDLLRANGFRHWRAKGMMIEPSQWRSPMTQSTRVELLEPGEADTRRVDDFVDAYAAVFCRAWDAKGPIDDYRAAFQRAHERGTHLLALAFQNGEPIGVSKAYLGLPSGSAYLMNATVLPAYRGQGTYRAMITARLRFLAQNGYQQAFTAARGSTSAPLLERWGFHTQYEYDMFQLDADAS